MSKSINFMLFIFGAAVGSAATWTYAKKKYELIAQEEIDSVKEVFSKRENGNMVKEAEFNKQEGKPDLKEYAAKIRESNYTNYSDTDGKSETKRETRKQDERDKKGYFAYVITPEEFGEFDDYEKISLSYFDDQILADENLDIVDDIEETVGIDSLTHFGEYEDDSVFVRNDERKCDYEILLDHRNYEDVIKKKPQSTEV